MPQTATNQDLPVTWNGTPISQSMDASFDDAVATVDCTCLDDDQTDNRAGTLDPSGSLTISLKDGNNPSIATGDVGVLGVGGLSGKVLITSASTGGGANGARELRLSFVSTNESVGT